MIWRRGLLGLGLLVPILAVLALGFGLDPHAVPSVRVGRPAPPFSLRGLDGNAFSSERLAGRPAVINFWSTWCYPCRAEAPLLELAAERLAGRVQFLGVIYQDQESAVRQAAQQHPLAYPTLFDPGSQAAMDYGVSGVPETFFVSPEGIILYKHAGALTYDIPAPGVGALFAPGSLAARMRRGVGRVIAFAAGMLPGPAGLGSPRCRRSGLSAGERSCAARSVRGCPSPSPPARWPRT